MRQVRGLRGRLPGGRHCEALRGRLTTELLNVETPDAPYRKVDGKFQEASWARTPGLQGLLERLSEADAER